MKKNTSIKSLLSAGSHQLKSISAEEGAAFFEANLLLQYTLNVNRAWLISHQDDALTEEECKKFDNLLKQRCSGIPIAYILGEREFYGLKLKVTADTLIPRPDTETLVETALAKITANQPNKTLDLGTGTGAIALAIAKNRPSAHVTAIDASNQALLIAQENAKNLNVTNITFTHSNWFDAIPNQTFDLIVSNPPYIEENDPHLTQGDLRFEPRQALASGPDGLRDIQRIIDHAPAHLNSDGWLMFEHGYNQAEQVAILLKQAEFIDIQHVKDLAGITRVTLGKLPN